MIFLIEVIFLIPPTDGGSIRNDNSGYILGASIGGSLTANTYLFHLKGPVIPNISKESFSPI
jgi:hypothetical protein